MKVKNLETGAVETMQYGSALDAITAGTHEAHNEVETPPEFKAPPIVAPPPNIIVVQAASGADAHPVTSSAALLDAARKRVTAAEAAAKGARTEADKTKAEGELTAARQDLAKLGG